MVGDVVGDDVLACGVGARHERVKLFLRPEASVNSRVADGPVAVVAAELARHVGPCAVLHPGALGVGGDGRNPNGVHAQVCEITLLQLVQDAFQVAPHMVGQWLDGGVLHRFVVGSSPLWKRSTMATWWLPASRGG